jgi:phage gpG-like protein
MIRLRVKDLQPLNTRWWKPTKEEWVPVLLDDHPQFWKRQVDPTYQRPWARLTPRYASWKTQNYPGQPILRATGLMQDLAFIYTKGNVFKVKSTYYGKYHQFGTSRMEARPWMGVPDISLRQIVPIAWKNILKRYK